MNMSQACVSTASLEQPTLLSLTSPSPKAQLPMATLNRVIVAAILTVGTGGVANPQEANLHTFTGPISHICSFHVSQSEEERLLDAQEKITGIRHYLSLNMTDLARVLKVGRPTVYSWATTTVTLHNAHRQRIDAVYAIAREWRALSSKPMGSLVRQPFEDGRTMIDLLSPQELDAKAIRAGMQLIQEQQGRFDKRFTVAEAAKKAGVQLASRPRRNWRSSGEVV